MTSDFQTTTIFPPSPPVCEPICEKKIRGTFEYIKNNDTREMLINCWQAISLTEMWDFMKKDPGPYGFMFSSSDSPEVNIIFSKMEELPNRVGHSGLSMGWTLRQMQFIARYGEEEYEKQFL